MPARGLAVRGEGDPPVVEGPGHSAVVHGVFIRRKQIQKLGGADGRALRVLVAATSEARHDGQFVKIKCLARADAPEQCAEFSFRQRRILESFLTQHRRHPGIHDVHELHRLRPRQWASRGPIARELLGMLEHDAVSGVHRAALQVAERGGLGRELQPFLDADGRDALATGHGLPSVRRDAPDNTLRRPMSPRDSSHFPSPGSASLIPRALPTL